MKIAILGAGAFGTALGGILADNGYDVDYYDPKLNNNKLSDVVDGSKYILLCIPSNAVTHMLPKLPKDIPLIIATKGILNDETYCGFKDYMIISGPGFADDIKTGKHTILTITDDRLREMFKADFLEFDYTDDEKGVLMCGALKNVFAIGAGFKQLERETPEWKNYIRDTVFEMKLLLAENNARSETVDLVCGIGDLKLTCGLPSRNYEYGNILSSNSSYIAEKTVEGVTAIRKIMRGEIKVPEKCSILKEILEIVSSKDSD